MLGICRPQQKMLRGLMRARRAPPLLRRKRDYVLAVSSEFVIERIKICLNLLWRQVIGNDEIGLPISFSRSDAVNNPCTVLAPHNVRRYQTSLWPLLRRELFTRHAGRSEQVSSRTRDIRIREERHHPLPRPTATLGRRAECALRQPISRVGERTTSLFRRVERLARDR